MKISSQLSTISRNQKYFRTRENRNFSTVRSTERRIFNFSIIESLMIVGMAGLQVFVVRFFFQGARKGGFPLSIFFRSEIDRFTDVEQAMFDDDHDDLACVYILFVFELVSEFSNPAAMGLLVASACDIGFRYLPNAHCCDGL